MFTMNETQTLHPPSPQDPAPAFPQPVCLPSAPSTGQVLSCPGPLPRALPFPHLAFRKTGSKRKHGTLRQLKKDPRGCLKQKERGRAWHEMEVERKVRASRPSSLGILDFLLSARKSLPSVTSKWVTKLDLQVEKIIVATVWKSRAAQSRRGRCSRPGLRE